jgi:hypothetical protein
MMREPTSMFPRVQEPTWNEKRFQEPTRKSWNPLFWWYRFSTPNPEFAASQDAVIPRDRLASILLLVIFAGILAFIPAAVTSDGLHVVPPLIGMFLITCLATFLNKQGKVTAVGLLIVGAFDIALIYTLLSYPGFKLTQNAVPIYDMFVLSDIIAVSLLPINSILYFSLFHSAFMMGDIILQPHAPDLQLLIDQTTYSFMVRPLLIQLVAALVTYLWVRNTMKALERANRAEVIAELEHTIATQKQELDEGIQQILLTLVQAANGDMNVRVPLVQQRELWQVCVGLNTLLARLQSVHAQRTKLSERELQQIKMELNRLTYNIQRAKRMKTPLWFVPTGTNIDPLLNELVGYSLLPDPRTEKR